MAPTPQRGWSRNPLTQHQWQTNNPRDRTANAAQQDQAAGGHERRRIQTDTGTHVRGRIRFVSRPNTRRTYAYLVWSDKGRRQEFLITEVTGTNRLANLQAAWDVVHANDLTTAQGRKQWR